MRKWVVLIFLLNLVLRLLLVSWHSACYTDSIYYMTALKGIRGTFILPGYPFALLILRWIVGDPELAGRLVSMIAASLVVFPLYGLARIIYDHRSALFTIMLYTVSPLIFRWSLRIFPHALFSLFVVLSLYLIFQYVKVGKVGFLVSGIFIGGLAALTYPNGIILFPVAVFAVLAYFLKVIINEHRGRMWGITWVGGYALLCIVFYAWPVFHSRSLFYLSQVLNIFPVKLPGPRNIWALVFILGVWTILSLLGNFLLPFGKAVRGWWYKRPAALISLGLGFGSYVFLYVWQRYLARSFWYQKGMETSWLSVGRRWDAWLIHYLYSYPYILTYPVAIFVFLGVIITIIRARKNTRLWFWLAFYSYFFAGVSYALVVNKWWTPRYQYSLLPFALIFAGFGLSFLFSIRKLRWLGIVSLSLCLAGSMIFTALVLYWSRDSFGDIKRTALYIKDNYPGRNLYTDQGAKTGFWSKRRLRGYKRARSSSLKAGDIVLLAGWHTNLNTEYAYLNRFFQTEILHRENSTIVPLLADDIVDWAGKRLRRRANAPVVWEQRFEKQYFESWVIEIKGSRSEEKQAAFSSGKTSTLFQPLLTTQEKQATSFDVGVWEVLEPMKKGERIRLEIAHAREGPLGSFWMEVYTDQNGDGLPDQLEAQSLLLEGTHPGQWSAWEFIAPAEKLFVGRRWKLGNWVYYQRTSWPHKELGEIMYYSRGGLPKHKANPVITNLKISFPKNF